MSSLITLGFSLPSAYVVFKQPTQKNFKTALYTISMTFMFFSFHVHEKTILLPLMPVLINFELMKHFIVDFSLVCAFTNFHLLHEDGLDLQYYLIFVLYYYFGGQLQANLLRNYGQKRDKFIIFYTKYIRKTVYGAMMMLTVLYYTVKAPARFPYLHQTFYALLGVGYFGIVYLYVHYKMFQDY